MSPTFFAYSFIRSFSIALVQFIFCGGGDGSFPSVDHLASILTWRWSDVLSWWCCRISDYSTRAAWAADSRTRSIKDLVLSLENVYLGPFVRLLRVTGYKEHLSISCPRVLVLLPSSDELPIWVACHHHSYYRHDGIFQQLKIIVKFFNLLVSGGQVMACMTEWWRVV